MSHKIITGAFGALLAAGLLAGGATAATAATMAPPITATLAGSSTPVIVNGVVYASATVTASAKTGLYVQITLSDNNAHTHAVKTNTNVGVSELATGSATLPAIKGHSYGSLVRYGFQAVANTGPYTYRTVTFTGPRAAVTASADGLSWNGLSWDGLSWDKAA